MKCEALALRTSGLVLALLGLDLGLGVDTVGLVNITSSERLFKNFTITEKEEHNKATYIISFYAECKENDTRCATLNARKHSLMLKPSGKTTQLANANFSFKLKLVSMKSQVQLCCSSTFTNSDVFDTQSLASQFCFLVEEQHNLRSLGPTDELSEFNCRGRSAQLSLCARETSWPLHFVVENTTLATHMQTK